jgi:hypothetical protein
MVLAEKQAMQGKGLLPTSPIPRPGIFPPTLKGSLVSDQVLP